MSRPLRTEADIRAAGAEAVSGWQLSDRQVDKVVAILTPAEQAKGERDGKPAAPAA